jgi:hypothetical protein
LGQNIPGWLKAFSLLVSWDQPIFPRLFAKKSRIEQISPLHSKSENALARDQLPMLEKRA